MRDSSFNRGAEIPSESVESQCLGDDLRCLSLGQSVVTLDESDDGMIDFSGRELVRVAKAVRIHLGAVPGSDRGGLQTQKRSFLVRDSRCHELCHCSLDSLVNAGPGPAYTSRRYIFGISFPVRYTCLSSAVFFSDDHT